nr:hypothetical protein [Tanacetum cinerariifolium]
MDDNVDVSIPDPSRPTWNNMVNSPTVETHHDSTITRKYAGHQLHVLGFHMEFTFEFILSSFTSYRFALNTLSYI